MGNCRMGNLTRVVKLITRNSFVAKLSRSEGIHLFINAMTLFCSLQHRVDSCRFLKLSIWSIFSPSACVALSRPPPSTPWSVELMT